MLKALLRERHWQNYGLFKRAYQKAAKGLDKDLVDTYPSRATLHRWMTGQVKDLPYPDHCAVLEAMLPGWRAAELFTPYVAPDKVGGSTLLRELLRRRCLHNYREFCRAYDVTAAAIDPALVGGYPAQQQFHRWICAEPIELPHPGHCTVLEAMFSGYSARQLFEITEPPEPARPDQPDPEAPDDRPAMSGVVGLVMPDQTSVSTVTALTALALPDQVVVSLLQHLESLTSSLVTPGERDRAYYQLVPLLRRWAHTMDRRDALQFLYRAAIAASAAGALDWDGYERVVSVLSGSSRVDPQTIGHIEAVLWRCNRQDDALGPHAALDTVLAQRQLARSLLPQCPAPLRSRLLTVVSESSRQAGWLSFDLNQFDDAGYYYEDARALAHEAQNTGLGAFVLCQMSHLATWRGMPRTGIDHAVAAGQWAGRSDDQRLRAYTFDVAARAYAADGQRNACLTALDAAHTVLTSASGQAPGSVYFYDEALHTSVRGMCHLELGDGQRAADYQRQSLNDLDQSFTRNMAFAKADLGMAHVQGKEIDEAARLLGDAGQIAAGNSSARLSERLRYDRAQLQPWQDTTAVRELDDRFTTYGLT
ncbi:MAG: hypothetical protein ACRDSP_23365 [Pseudonocardiaceae bacterium]